LPAVARASRPRWRAHARVAVVAPLRGSLVGGGLTRAYALGYPIPPLRGSGVAQLKARTVEAADSLHAWTTPLTTG